jgi:hypothetical protein
MTYFPQLVTGATVQFPGTRLTVRRTVVNEAADGHTVKLDDPAANAVEWRLALSGLTDAEWEALEWLFEAVEGRLGSFTFLDPFDNLLSWSEELSAAVWGKDAGLVVLAGIEDPLGTTRATRITNQGGLPGSIAQSVGGPGWYQYCFSVWARSAAPASIALFQRTPTAAASKVYGIGPTWKRLEHGAKLAAQEETVEFGATIEAGGAVELFGLQLEAQVGASQYRKTAARSGVHANASFLEDVLARTALGMDDNSCRLRIRASG